MISFQDAIQIISTCVLRNETERVSLEDALGRFLASEIFSETTLPLHDSAFKDGFAVRFGEVAEATAEKPVKLQIAGTSFAGGGYQQAVFPERVACKVTTGAYIPKSFDTVMPWEDCRVRDDSVIIGKPPRKYQDITPAGQELKSGERILRKGLMLCPADIGLAAAAGHALLPVARSPRVGILSTGNELVLPGHVLGDGQIYSSNQFQLKTQIKKMHMQAETRIIEDDFNATMQAVLEMIKQNDVLISSGGSADGEKDFMRRVLQELDWRLMVERVNIKPGHTLRFGMLHNKPFFVLPGTPSGTEICFNIFVVPLLLKMAGAEKVHPTPVYAKLREKIKGSPKTKTIAQVILSFEAEGPVLDLVPKECGRIKSIARKNALVIVPREGFEAGEMVAALPV